MIDDTYGATIAKRRLSRRLTELRLRSGWNGNEVCDKLAWGRGKVGRFEANAWVRPELSDIRDLLRIYEVSGEERQSLEQLAELARRRPWWREYSEVFENEFPGYENDAKRITVCMPLILPGLVQTRAYMEAYMRLSVKDPHWRQRAMEARQRRQCILERDDGTSPELVAVLTEASLVYRWGTQADRRAQIVHLAELSRRPNIELRLLRFEDGAHPVMSGMVNIFDFGDDEPSIVYLETEFAIEEVTKRNEVDTYVEAVGRLRDAALDAAGTTAHLEKLSQTLE